MTKSLTFPPLSIARYSFILLNQQECQWRERKCLIFETVAKGDSNPGSLDCESGILARSTINWRLCWAQSMDLRNPWIELNLFNNNSHMNDMSQKTFPTTLLDYVVHYIVTNQLFIQPFRNRSFYNNCDALVFCVFLFACTSHLILYTALLNEYLSTAVLTTCIYSFVM